MQLAVASGFPDQSQQKTLGGNPLAMPEFSRPSEYVLIGVAETDTGGRCREHTEARPGRSGANVVRIDNNNVLTGASELDRRYDARDPGADDDSVRGFGKRLCDTVVIAFPPAGEGVRQGLSLGV